MIRTRTVHHITLDILVSLHCVKRCLGLTLSIKTYPMMTITMVAAGVITLLLSLPIVKRWNLSTLSINTNTMMTMSMGPTWVILS